jgi:hypothetical protein
VLTTPEAQTGSATSVTTTSAQVHALVNSGGTPGASYAI